MDQILIQTPRPSSTVGQLFNARGSWTYSSTPGITCVLKDSSGTVVATGTTTVGDAGSWSSAFSVSQGYTDATVTATIDGTEITASSTGITVI
jgi:hypothetical protein